MASVANSANSICGIDVGTENCYLAVARAGGIEILLNEYSQRSTPAYIAFGGNQRELGVSAKQKQMMNLSNTCFAPITIIGKKFKDLNLDEIPYRVEEDSNGDVLVRVNHNGEELLLTATQVLAMLFTKLRQISGNVIDCVINCPNHFTDTQRRALIDAACIAGLNPLRIISDMTAVALYYGFYRSSASPQDHTIIGFVDCGHTSTQAAIVLFNHKENTMRVLDAEYESNIGGKHFDEILANYFIQKQKLQLSKRARYRLIAECERLKKQMSANSNELPINIECLQDDQDFTGRIDRATFENISSEILQKIQDMFALTYKRAGEKFNKDFAEKLGAFRVDSVEVVGGTSRIPAIKRLVKQIFNVEPSTTLNADEAVARGCALQCAILSPTFKVARELQIVDSLAYPVNFRYAVADAKEFKTVTGLYPRGHSYPFTKQISINCHTLPLATAFDYINNDGVTVPFAQFNILEPNNSNAAHYLSTSPIKFRVRVDANGLVSIYSAQVSYEKPAEEKTAEPMDLSSNNGSQTVANEADAEQKMETDENNVDSEKLSEKNATPETNQPSAEEPKKKPKNKTVTIDLLIESVFIAGKLPTEVLQQYIEVESNFILADKNWKEKTDAKNTLEEFIYEWRERLESSGYDAFIHPADKEKFMQLLESNEKWIYEQDEQELMHSKSVYDEKTNMMADTYGKKILYRKREFEGRHRLLEELGQHLQLARKHADVREPAEQEEVTAFLTQLDSKQVWFDEAQGKLSHSSTYDDPPVKCDDISAQIRDVTAAINKIENSRKRRAEEKERKKAEAAAKAAAEAAAKKAESAAKASSSQEDGDNTSSDNTANTVDQMEVDHEQTAASAATASPTA